MRQAEWGELGGGTVGSYGEEQQGSSAVKFSSFSCLWVGPLPASRRRSQPPRPARQNGQASAHSSNGRRKKHFALTTCTYIGGGGIEKGNRWKEAESPSLFPPSSTAAHCTDGSPPPRPRLGLGSRAGQVENREGRRERRSGWGRPRGGKEDGEGEAESHRRKSERVLGESREREREREAPSPSPPHARTCAPCNTRTRRRTRSRGEARRREGEKWLSFFPAPTLSLFLGTNSEGREGRKLRNRATERESIEGGARRRRLARRMHSLPAADQISLSLFLRGPQKGGDAYAAKGGCCTGAGPAAAAAGFQERILPRRGGEQKEH